MHEVLEQCALFIRENLPMSCDAHARSLWQRTFFFGLTSDAGLDKFAYEADLISSEWFCWRVAAEISRRVNPLLASSANLCTAQFRARLANPELLFFDEQGPACVFSVAHCDSVFTPDYSWQTVVWHLEIGCRAQEPISINATPKKKKKDESAVHNSGSIITNPRRI